MVKIMKKTVKKSLVKPEKALKKVKTKVKVTKNVKSKSKKKLSKTPVVEFMEHDLEDEQNDSEMSEGAQENVEESDIDGNSELGDEVEHHKQALSKLKDTDPEFYKFLQENDKKLLEFNVSDDEADSGDGDTDSLHKATEDLEVASDESDFEAENEVKVKDHGVITLKMLKAWQNNIGTDQSNKTIVALTQAFHAALLRVSTEEEEQDSCPYKVEGSAVFNAVIQLCVMSLGPALKQFLKISSGSKQPPHKSKKFSKVKTVLKSYFADLSKLLSGVSSANIQTVLLKHLHYMSPFLASFPNITKSILKRLVNLWATGDEGVRVISFLCILRITNSQRDTLLDMILKLMYMTYVNNSKFVSVNSLAGLNFMRRSLVEMFSLDFNISYQHAFLYIRQLAIHLRNAIVTKKKENFQAVYNWQFISSLKLWGNLLGLNCDKQPLQQLIYPLVQVCLGTVKLIPTTQYYPLRFHVCQILIDLSKESGVFIPVLPFILEVLTAYDFNKKHLKVSMKPIQFTCLLRASKSQMSENGFKDALIENIYSLLIEYLTSHSHCLTFPDLSIFCSAQIKKFIKQCSNSNYTRKMKQLLEKIEQNNQFIESERASLQIKLTDFKQIEGFETQIKNKVTPLLKFFVEWNKLHKIKKNKEFTNNDKLGEYELPVIKRKVSNKLNDKEKNDGPVELFPSDSDDSDLDFGKEEETKKRRGKRGGKTTKKQKLDINNEEPIVDENQKDLVQDLRIDDW